MSPPSSKIFHNARVTVPREGVLPVFVNQVLPTPTCMDSGMVGTDGFEDDVDCAT